ncbi:MAG: dihydrofolate reductase [Candidatus Beckwithbacteria bacterium]|nr:dihydrofolate reductase [Patescibacteria group bacterium]
MSATISIIVAHDDNFGIGKKGKIPWHISADFKYFKKITTKHPIIMGRKTFESIGKPLPNRPNIIITRHPQYSAPERNIQVIHSLQKAIALAKTLDQKEIFIIGGGEIYKQALPFADKLYITHIKGNFNCDTFFPDYSSQFNKIISKKTNQSNKYSYTFLELERQL